MNTIYSNDRFFLCFLFSFFFVFFAQTVFHPKHPNHWLMSSTFKLFGVTVPLHLDYGRPFLFLLLYFLPWRFPIKQLVSPYPLVCQFNCVSRFMQDSLRIANWYFLKGLSPCLIVPVVIFFLFFPFHFPFPFSHFRFTFAFFCRLLNCAFMGLLLLNQVSYLCNYGGHFC